MSKNRTENPLTALIKERSGVLGLDQVALLKRLEDEHNVVVHKSAISMWFRGGGVADEHRPALAAVLGISLHDLQTAASERARQRAADRAAKRSAA